MPWFRPVLARGWHGTCPSSRTVGVCLLGWWKCSVGFMLRVADSGDCPGGLLYSVAVRLRSRRLPFGLFVVDFPHARSRVHEVCPPGGLSRCQVICKHDGLVVVLGQVLRGHFGCHGNQRTRAGLDVADTQHPAGRGVPHDHMGRAGRRICNGAPTLEGLPTVLTSGSRSRSRRPQPRSGHRGGRSRASSAKLPGPSAQTLGPVLHKSPPFAGAPIRLNKKATLVGNETREKCDLARIQAFTSVR